MKGLERDLSDACDSLESLLVKLPKMSMAEKVDAAARLNAVAKSAEKFDKAVKEEIKKSLKHKNGSVLGTVFKAVLNVVPTDRFNQKALKEQEPNIYNVYVDTTDVERITFEPR